MTPFHRYRRILLIACGLLLGGVAALNLVVDPRFAFDLGWTPSLDAFRKNDSRTAKAAMVRRGGYDVLVAGTSRMGWSLDPRSRAWEGREVYNGGIDGGDWAEMRGMLDAGLDVASAKEFIVEVDLFPFWRKHSPEGDFETSLLNPAITPTEYLFPNLCGWGATKDSFEVLERALVGARPMEKGMAAPTRPDGFNVKSGRGRLVWHEFTWSMEQNFFLQPISFSGYTLDESRVRELETLALEGASRGKRVVLVVMPIHALQMEGMHITGVWTRFEELIRRLAPLPGRTAPGAGGAVEVWSFMDYSPEGSEEVGEDPARVSAWYVDSNHGRTVLGDRVIAAIRRGGMDGRGWGRTLDGGSVDVYLAGLERDRKAYVAAHGEQVERLRRMYDSLAAERAWKLRLLEANAAGARALVK